MTFINDKRIAILIGTYNGEIYLTELLDSLLNQDCRDWRAYIHDDGSADNTNTIIDKYCKNRPEHFTRIAAVSSGGAKENFMLLTKCIESELYMYCDQDDVWLSDKISVTLQAMTEINKSDQPCLVYTDLAVVDANLNPISKSMETYQMLPCKKISFARALIQNTVSGCTMMINRSLRDEMCRPCKMENIIMHDWWAYLIATAFGKVKYIGRATIQYRQHGNNSVGAKKIRSLNYIHNRIPKIKSSLDATRVQAEEFTKTFNMGTSSLCAIYSNIGNYNKIKRIFLYMKYGFSKGSLYKNIGLLLFG